MPEVTSSNERDSGFRLFNAALITSLVTFIIASVVTGGLSVFALLPITESGQPPIAIGFGDDSKKFLYIPVGVLMLSWIVSGFANQRGLVQLITSIIAFSASVGISAILAISVLAAGMAH